MKNPMEDITKQLGLDAETRNRRFEENKRDYVVAQLKQKVNELRMRATDY